MKGQISMVELVAAVGILFIALNVFFPSISEKSKKEKALIKMLERDLLISLDRNGSFYETSLNESWIGKGGKAGAIFFEAGIKKDLGFWIRYLSKNEFKGEKRVQNTITKFIPVFCNCTDLQLKFLQTHASKLIINGREVSISYEAISLDKVKNILEFSDALIIWNDKPLDEYRNLLLKYLKSGRGIVKISDITSPLDSTTKEIFGVQYLGLSAKETNTSFVYPKSIDDTSYFFTKYFFKVPLMINGSYYGNVPIENGIPSCTNSYNGTFDFRDKSFKFWICNKKVYFDTDGNGLADKIVNEREKFQLDNFNFSINYVKKESIYMVFRDTYNFTDIVGPSRVKALDENNIILYLGNYVGTNKKVPALTLNKSLGKAIWMVNVGRNGVENIKDDETRLIVTAILSSLGLYKDLKGYDVKTSYIDVENLDMYEVYQVDFGMSHVI
ncbi:MAG: hypothetical protein J7L39_04165 [Candidatus Aenigmarchaeota archaeon]|nr:hypothetical protein [Candidatus Aenigmarchaeota archaeon]